MQILAGVCLGLVAWFVLRILLMGVYTVDQNERAVKTRFGRAVRVPGGKTTLDDPVSETLRPEERARYTYPQVRVIPPGGPYFKMPWEKIYKVSIATMTVNMALDPESPAANDNGSDGEPGRGQDRLRTCSGRQDVLVGLAVELGPRTRRGVEEPGCGAEVHGVGHLQAVHRLRRLEERLGVCPARDAYLDVPEPELPGGRVGLRPAHLEGDRLSQRQSPRASGAASSRRPVRGNPRIRGLRPGGLCSDHRGDRRPGVGRDSTGKEPDDSTASRHHGRL